MFVQHHRIYLAATVHNAVQDAVADYPYLLESYHYLGKSQRLMDTLRAYGMKVFLDSGAFSAFNIGAEIDVDAYSQFIKDNRDVIDVASVVDGIGDAQMTLDNQKRAEDAGVRVLPCFHFGEDPVYLEHYLENYEYITLGGMVPPSTKQLREWLDWIWPCYLTDAQGWPRVRVHGFGLTSMNLVRRYPWFSVDSSSWVQVASFGGIVTVNDDGTISTLAISHDSPRIHEMNQHYDNLAPPLKERVTQEIRQFGWEPEMLRLYSIERKKYNAVVYGSLGTREPFPYVQPSNEGLF